MRNGIKILCNVMTIKCNYLLPYTTASKSKIGLNSILSFMKMTLSITLLLALQDYSRACASPETNQRAMRRMVTLSIVLYDYEYECASPLGFQAASLFRSLTLSLFE